MLGDKIKKLRNKKGIYQQALADALSVSKSTVAMWETNQREPDLETIRKIADFFECPIDYLIADTITFDFRPSSEGENFITCPICGYDNVHFVRTLSVNFENDKSAGLAIEFEGECGHTFYQIFETYKGYTYTILADKHGIIDFDTDTQFVSVPVSLEELWNEDNVKKINAMFKSLDKHGQKIINLVAEEEYKRCKTQEAKKSDNVINIPFYELTAVSAGYGLYDDNNEYPTVKQVPRTPVTEQANFCCYVKGNSMQPLYNDGDLIFVDTSQIVEFGDIGIFNLHGEMYIKKRGEAELISINSEYPNIQQNPDIICQGKVIGKI